MIIDEPTPTPRRLERYCDMHMLNHLTPPQIVLEAWEDEQELGDDGAWRVIGQRQLRTAILSDEILIDPESKALFRADDLAAVSEHPGAVSSRDFVMGKYASMWVATKADVEELAAINRLFDPVGGEA